MVDSSNDSKIIGEALESLRLQEEINLAERATEDHINRIESYLNEDKLTPHIITLKNFSDLENFYEEMENLGGDSNIPSRMVDVDARRPISRNTHYLLTPAEAASLINDSRVEGIVPVSLIPEPETFTFINDGLFNRSDGPSSSNEINWGLLRHTVDTNPTNFGIEDQNNYAHDYEEPSSYHTSDVTITSSGKNVDVVIVDGYLNPDHPEFAVNEDGSGGSRVNQIDWFSIYRANFASATNPFVYTPYIDEDFYYSAGSTNYSKYFLRTGDNNHGCHVASTAAGNRHGWARDASIYNMNPLTSSVNGSVFRPTTTSTYLST